MWVGTWMFQEQLSVLPHSLSGPVSLKHLPHIRVNHHNTKLSHIPL